MVCNFSIKVDEEPVWGEDKPKAKWLSVTTRGEVARYAAVIAKGNSVVVCGRLKQRSYTGRDDEQKTVTELHAEFVQIQMDAVSLNGFGGAPSGTHDFSELPDDDGDVPF